MITHYNTKPGKSVVWTLPLITTIEVDLIEGQKYCIHCDGPIPKRKGVSWQRYEGLKFCSPRCASIWHVANSTRAIPCETCGKEIKSTAHNRRFCSETCRNKHHNNA